MVWCRRVLIPAMLVGLLAPSLDLAGVLVREGADALVATPEGTCPLHGGSPGVCRMKNCPMHRTSSADDDSGTSADALCQLVCTSSSAAFLLPWNAVGLLPIVSSLPHPAVVPMRAKGLLVALACGVASVPIPPPRA